MTSAIIVHDLGDDVWRSRGAISCLRMRVLLLSCFLGATLIAGSILPAAFLFQAAPLPAPLKQVRGSL